MSMRISRRRFVQGAVALAAYEGCLFPARAARSPMRAAAALVDSVGVCVHLSYSNTPYGHFEDLVMPRLLESGIRHVRDGIPTGPKTTGREWIFRRGRELVANGIRFSCVTSYQSPISGGTDTAYLEASVDFYNGGVAFIEGPNEPNLGKKDPDWAQRLADYQRTLYDAVKSVGSLRDIPVLGPSITQGGGGPVGDISAAMDYGNIHPYPGGRWPESGNLDGHIKDAKTTDGDKPLVVTETGYHSALQTKRGHPPISEAAIARYMPRLLLFNLMKGIRRSYMYELVDTYNRGLADQESNFGLVRPSGEPKPAFHAVRNLISLFQDDGKAEAPRELSFEATPDDDLLTMSFQRSDGDILVAFWLGVAGWDISSLSIVPPVIRDVTFQFPQPMRLLSVHRFDDDGAVAVERKDVVSKRATMKVSDNLSVLRLRAPG